MPKKMQGKLENPVGKGGKASDHSVTIISQLLSLQIYFLTSLLQNFRFSFFNASKLSSYQTGGFVFDTPTILKVKF